jgi:hypothetical protein
MWALLLGVLVACRFDTSTSTPQQDADTPRVDAETDANRNDACAQPIDLRLKVADVSEVPASGVPYAHILVGDTIELSAAGSCAQVGELSFSWTISPLTTGVADTALPNLNAETIEVYAPDAEQYTVRLTATDSQGNSEFIDAFAFEAAGFAPLDAIGGAAVRDLHVGQSSLWIASNAGAFEADLSAPLTVPYPSVNSSYGGEDLPASLAAVHEEGERVYFARRANSDQLWQLNTADQNVAVLDLPESVDSNEIGPAVAGVRLATDQGTFISTDSSTFTLERAEAASAITDGVAGAWSGSSRLYRISDGQDYNIFGGNNRITAIENLEAVLWVGGQGQGIATVVGGAPVEIFRTQTSNLIDNRVNDIAFDASGDAWVATQRGVARFKRDREEWVAIGVEDGLSNHLDLKSIAVDEANGRRTIYAGGTNGLVRLAAP